MPSWSETRLLALVFQGAPEDLRLVWEAAQGVSRPSFQDAGEAQRHLCAALRGLHLAAGEPDLADLCRGTDVTSEAAIGVLASGIVPDWPTTARLATLLAADPALVRPLWESVHYARLVAAASSGGR
ncbi:hypothetical protein ACFYVL_08970 [Streptomyces sp. NPDC004111]|uniref:hypothetical protein n=1 Tax=Streptomyces sp. NPDC004111 TaxID=3364690 RepID=UPI0036CDAA74